MRFDRSIGLSLLLVICGSGWASPRKEDSATDQVLRERGATKVGTVYVIEAEKPVLAKWKEVRTSFAAYAAMSDQQAVAQQLADRASHLEEERATCKENSKT